MKKTILYSLAAVASLALAGCNGNYDDWASPQSYSAEEAAAKYGVTFVAGPEANDDMTDEDGMVNLVEVTSSSSDVSGFTVKSVTINGQKVDATMSGKYIQVSAKDLDKLVVEQNGSRASVARDLAVQSSVAINLASGDAVAVDVTGATAGTFKPYATPAIDEKGYFMLGNLSENGGGWDATAPVWMTKVSDGVYQAKVTTTGTGSNWYKFYCGSNFVSGDWNSINAGQMGCLTNGDDAATGYIIYPNDPWGDVQTPVITGAGTWIVTLDMNNLTYTVKKPILYVAGDCNGWKQIDYLAGNDGVKFTGYMYLNQNGFKFCTQQDWNGTNYGADFSTAGDAGNIVMTESAGYYKVDVDLSAKTYTLTAITTIGLIGDATPGGWSTSTPMTYNAEDRAWEISGVTLTDGSIKFRANDGWDINWGGKTTDALTQGGDNINVKAGTYNIKLYAWADGFAKCEITQ
jgi:hypothetical protein